MPDILNALILSGHMTREHDNKHRSFRSHNQWLTTVPEDTGRFRVRVVEDPRGLGASVIDKYDVVRRCCRPLSPAIPSPRASAKPGR